jgi:hypothetical protein
MQQVQRHIDVVWRFLWAFDTDTEAFRETLHSEIEWFPFEDGHRPTQGVDAAMRCRGHWIDTWEEHRMEVEELVADGEDVVVSLHVIARGKVSGIEVNVRIHPHYKLREEKVVYIFEHHDRESALEAAGLAA